jgi:hypothetical protein
MQAANQGLIAKSIEQQEHTGALPACRSVPELTQRQRFDPARLLNCGQVAD